MYVLPKLVNESIAVACSVSTMKLLTLHTKYIFEPVTRCVIGPQILCLLWGPDLPSVINRYIESWLPV